MRAETRRKTILTLLNEFESISVADVASKCNIADITARRDLDELSKQGLIVRTHGGAVKSTTIEVLAGFSKEESLNKEAKEAICKHAASFINENEIIYMDCGTTVYRLARHITPIKNLRVLTNSLLVVSELIKYPNIKVNLIGGELDNARLALYGPTTESSMMKYKADKAFIGAGGISLVSGLSTGGEKEASITMKMASSASEVILLADASKFERSSFYTYAPITIAHTIITDKGISQEIRDLYLNNKINIIIV